MISYYILVSLISYLIHYPSFTINYDSLTMQPTWVEYTFRPSSIKYKRPSGFRQDKSISLIQQHDSFYEEGMDRGHLVPADDMSGDSIALAATFYFTNISPQYVSFNRGIWKRLEIYTRQKGKENDSVRVTAGPLFIGLPVLMHNKVPVASYFFKCIQYSTKKEYYIIPHSKEKTSYDIIEFEVDSQLFELITGVAR